MGNYNKANKSYIINYKYVEEQDLEEHSDEEEHEDKTEITGGSTVQDALDLGITQQQVEKVLEGPANNPHEKIKDIATQRGL